MERGSGDPRHPAAWVVPAPDLGGSPGVRPPSRAPCSARMTSLTATMPDVRLAREGSQVRPGIEARESGPATSEPGRKGLLLGILAYRIAAFVWMTILAVVTQSQGGFDHAAVAWSALAITGLWTAWFGLTKAWER